MFSKDRWNEILESLTANKFRTLLTAFGVFWGITILVLLLALTNGLKNGATVEFSDFATNSILTWSQGTSIAYKGLPRRRRFSYKLDDIEALKTQFPEIKYASPRNKLGGYRGGNNVIRGTKIGAFGIFGDYPDYIKQEPMDILEGRFVSYSDIEAKRKVCVIGVDVIAGLYDKEETVIGSYIEINGVNFMVVGTFKKPNSQGDAEEEANAIIIPFTTFNQAFNQGDRIYYMVITAFDAFDITELKESIFSFLKARHNVHPNDMRALGHRDQSLEFKKISGLFSILSVVGYFVGALILLSGIIGISNIMLISVKERTKEIGVRRALGASPWNIKSQILQESLILTIISGMTGVVFSAAMIWLLNYLIEQNGPVQNFINPSVGMQVIITAITLLTVSGLLAGLIPANNATKMKPIDALRIE
ncbi:ABC transporter permease [Winogradskyella sp. UBA3174]|uniref:ABC transporter permease n=1 Tax=Winogradskyella sp. UBA3174 TaxID=1947785 RepID=UPI0025E17400|nr:ABC transporter permease [Winogradskyella sp. UBA3174]|tara:strand:- start:8789 stop:10048 length:1260 start_codon:yes stop_codon:yes gene_type:complete